MRMAVSVLPGSLPPPFSALLSGGRSKAGRRPPHHLTERKPVKDWYASSGKCRVMAHVVDSTSSTTWPEQRRGWLPRWASWSMREQIG